MKSINICKNDWFQWIAFLLIMLDSSKGFKNGVWNNGQRFSFKWIPRWSGSIEKISFIEFMQG